MDGEPEGATILDGKALSAQIIEALRGRIERERLQPHLHVIIVGDDVASQVFVKQKRLAAEKAGALFSQTNLPLDASLGELRDVICRSNADRNIHGIIVQLPLPGELREREREVLNLVDPRKDVDCFHPSNYGQLALGEPSFLPATPAGILRLIESYGIETKGKRCVILGKSNIVGKPLGLLLGHEGGPAATVIMCDQYTEGVWDLTKQADILVVAAGKHHLLSDPGVLRADKQVAVIDVGIHRVQTPEGKTVVQGDVDASQIKPHCRWLTPVPGGVGPMTVACLLEQVVNAAARQSKPAELIAKATALGESRGKMCLAEVAELLEQLEPGLTADSVASTLQSVATDDDGRLFFGDFVRWLFADGR